MVRGTEAGTKLTALRSIRAIGSLEKLQLTTEVWRVLRLIARVQQNDAVRTPLAGMDTVHLASRALVRLDACL